MGGFTVDGCGVGDSFYPKLNLGNHFCKYCNSIQEFALMEVKRKIKVFYIPTLSINTKFAVGCKKCKNGYYIDDKVRDGLLYGRMAIEVESDGIIFKTIQNTAQDIDTVQNENAIQSAGTVKNTNVIQNADAGQNGNVMQDKEKNPHQSAQPKASQKIRYCKCCGSKLEPDQIFCTFCGVKIK
ncbi:MAG: zinc-ribbon domain-containing protein [Eubacteriales bacterium]|nr:zinc-ribbon domain-containing protein [Eubacteriales bacterium]